MQPASKRQKLYSLIFVLIVVIALFAVLPQLHNFRGSLMTLQHARPLVAVLAAGFVVVALLCAAGVYQLLSYRRLNYWNTLLVQLSGLFVNRVVPAGFGGLGLNYLYLKRQKHSNTQATTIVALNNLFGGVGHALLFGVMLLIVHLSYYQIALPRPRLQVHSWELAAAVAILGGLVWVLAARRAKLRPVRGKVIAQLQILANYYRQRPLRIGAALLVSMGLTLSNVLALYFCCLAIGVHLPFALVFFVFTLGVAVGTAVPSPGGLGGTEAGLVAGLIAQNIAAPSALAAVLLYRLVSFWPGLVIGAGALYIVQKKQLLTAKS